MPIDPNSAEGGPRFLNGQPVRRGEPGLWVQGEPAQAAAGLNYIDVYHRKGLLLAAAPLVPGLEGAGNRRGGSPRMGAV